MKKLLLVIWLACLAVGFSARGQAVVDPNNTIVRLSIVVNGTNFGNIDLELFDQEKPETVRNFLMYVYSGSYSNMIIHELLANRTLRSGHVLPDGTNQLSTGIGRVQSFGSISNEFSRGPELANNFGTIAMVPTNWHGGASIGSMDWVINLTNNLSFNAANPYVVFGRVVDTDGPLSGTNLLNYFNTFRLGTNIRGVSIGLVNTESMLIPVTAAYPERFPNTAEMYLVNASVIRSSTPHDLQAPTIQITQPNGLTTNETQGPLEFTGTAMDNQRVRRVIYDYGYPYQRFTAEGTENWSSNVFLFPSTNHVTFRSVDDFGNLSAPITRDVYYPFITVNLVTTNSAYGKVTGLVNGQTIRLGETYRVQAKPKPGKYFLGWRGDISADNRVIDLTIPPEYWYATNIYAYFTRTFIGLSNGTYQGLFFPNTNGPSRSAGWISLNLAPNGQYSGVLRPLGANYQIRGAFDANGHSIIQGARGSVLLTLALSLTADPTAEIIGGTYNDGTFLSQVAMFRAQKFAVGAPPAQAGNYSFQIDPAQGSAAEALGRMGSGNAIIDARGKIKMTGTLGEDLEIRQTAKLLKFDYWPFFATANGGREAVLGWARLTNNNIFTADIKWWSPDFPGSTNQLAVLDGTRTGALAADGPPSILLSNEKNAEFGQPAPTDWTSRSAAEQNPTLQKSDVRHGFFAPPTVQPGPTPR